MKKTELLKKIHELIWENDDLMNQETLFSLQDLIDIEIIKEAKKGNLEIKKYNNGYIYFIKIIK